MKQTEIYTGIIYGLGRVHRSGTDATGERARVIEKGISGVYSQRADRVKVELVDDEGNAKVWEDTEYNQKWNKAKIGQPITKIVRAREILDLAEVQRQEEEARKAEEHREHVRQLKDAAEKDAQDAIQKVINPKIEARIQTQYDPPGDVAFVSAITFRYVDDDDNDAARFIEWVKKIGAPNES